MGPSGPWPAASSSVSRAGGGLRLREAGCCPDSRALRSRVSSSDADVPGLTAAIRTALGPRPPLSAVHGGGGGAAGRGGRGLPSGPGYCLWRGRRCGASEPGGLDGGRGLRFGAGARGGVAGPRRASGEGGASGGAGPRSRGRGRSPRAPIGPREPAPPRPLLKSPPLRRVPGSAG